MSAIFKREFKSYFNNMMGYVVIAGTLLLISLYCYNTNFTQGFPNFEYSLEAASGILFILVVPLLTMKTFADERRLKTDQLLLTSPLSVPSIVLGKFLGTICVFGIGLCVAAFFPVVLNIMGAVNFLTAYSGLLGMFFMSCALIAIGMFISSLTENPLISAVVTLCAMLALSSIGLISSHVPTAAKTNYIILVVLSIVAVLAIYALTRSFAVAVGAAVIFEGGLILLYKLAPTVLEGSVGKLLGAIAVFDKMNAFVYGMFDINTLLYYLTVAALFIFFTVQSIEKRRWN